MGNGDGTGISATTRNRLILGVGTFTVNGVSIGATQKEGVFAVEQEIYAPSLGGARGPVEGTEKVLSEIPSLELPMVEVSVSNLARVLPSVSSDSDATSEYTKLEEFGYLAVAQYVDVVWTGKTMNDKEVVITLYNCRAEGGISMNLSDDGETVYTVKFLGFYAPADPDVRIWKLETEI